MNSQYDQTNPRRSGRDRKPAAKYYSPSQESFFSYGNVSDSYDDREFSPERVARRKPVNRSTVQKKNTTKEPPLKMAQPFNKKKNQELAQKYPDEYWSESSERIEFVNEKNQLITEPNTLQHAGSIVSVAWSKDGNLLATGSSLGSIKIWETGTWTLLKEFRDLDETEIEEVYKIKFLGIENHIIYGGKRKYRNLWSNEDDDNKHAPCHIKIVNLITNEVSVFEGPEEEISDIKHVQFKDQFYILASSQDGFIYKWLIDETYSVLNDPQLIIDNKTCESGQISFLANCGNKYFVTAADTGIKLYDFEDDSFIHYWDNIYDFLLEHIKVIFCKEIEQTSDQQHILAKGLELVKPEDNRTPIKLNSIKLYQITFPKNGQNNWLLTQIRNFTSQDPLYESNFKMLKLCSNGRYLFAPTSNGKIFVWNLRTGAVTAILEGHDESSIVYDIKFNPTKKLLVSSSDDSTVKIYSQFNNNDESKMDQS